MTKDLLKSIVSDTRLTSDAVRVVLHVATKGKGPHPISHLDFTILLNHTSDKRVRAAVRLAVEAGYVDRQIGGRGKVDRFAFRVAPTDTLSDPKEAPKDPLRVAPTDTLSGESTQKPAELRVPQGGTLRLSLPPTGNLSQHRVPPGATLKGLGYIKESLEEVVDVSAGARERSDFSIGENEKFSGEKAIDINAEILKGCRGALRDYLDIKVGDPTRQYGYVQTVVGWLQGTDPKLWTTPAGDTIQPNERAPLLAEALNDLLGSDESRMARPVGDPGNLRTKTSVLVTMRASRERRVAAKAEAKPSSASSPNPTPRNPSHKFIIESGA